MEDNADFYDILKGSEVRAGMEGMVINLYSDGTFERSAMTVDEVIDGNTISDSAFNSLKHLASAQNDNYFLEFEKEDLKNMYVIVSHDMIFLYDIEYGPGKSGCYSRFVVPANQRWKSSNKLNKANKNIGLFEMRHLKSFKNHFGN